MPDEIQGGEGTAGLPAAEKLAATYGVLTDIYGVISQIARNPVTSAEAVRRIGSHLEQYWIKNLKESNTLSEEAAKRFDELAKRGRTYTQILTGIGGAAAGAGLRLAYMTEQLER